MKLNRGFFLPLIGMGLVFGIILAGHARAQHAELEQQLSKNKHALTFKNGELKGEGADFLFNEAKASQFFLIGEDHGIAELPQFTAALFKQIHADGYHNFAIEAGPLTARLLGSMAASANARQAFREFNQQNPFSVPFYNWQEEAALLEAVVKSSQSGANILWGLDQEFILSAKLHLKRLVELAPNDSARSVASEFNEKAQTEFSRMVESKNPSLVFLASAQESDFKKLEAAFNQQPNSEAAEILGELKTSWEIYAKNFRGEYDSNAQRAQLMAHKTPIYPLSEMSRIRPKRSMRLKHITFWT